MRQRFQSLPKDDAGIVALYVAILAPVLFMLCAFALDTARWYVEVQNTQKAADAAALAGVTYLPSSPNDARATAIATATKNRFTSGTRVAVTVQTRADDPTLYPSQLRVTISSNIPNGFAAVMGFTRQTITRSAVADFAGPIPMGSPCNLFGREDMESAANQKASANCDSSAGQGWVNIAGKNVNKARGDGYSSGYCTKPDGSTGIDACSNPNGTPGATPGTPGAGVNTDYDPNGYIFKVRSSGFGSGTRNLRLEGYDMGWVATGDNCDQGNLVGVKPTNSYVTTTAEATARYAKNSSAYCTGDTQMSSPEGDGSTVQTVVTVRGQSSDPFNPLLGPVLCTETYAGWDLSTPVSSLTGGGAGNKLARTYHRWADLCSGTSLFSIAQNQDYSIQVQTIGGGGQNRFALRAYFTTGSNADVSIFAAGKVSLFNNVTAGTSRFKLVRLDTPTAGNYLTLKFFDLGDATQPVTAKVLQPDSLTPFANCVGIGPVAGSLTNCSVVTTAATNGGKWQTVSVPIPSTYTCSDDLDQSKCWVRIELTTRSGQADTTTWSASLDGDPVRLVV